MIASIAFSCGPAPFFVIDSAAAIEQDLQNPLFVSFAILWHLGHFSCPATRVCFNRNIWQGLQIPVDLTNVPAILWQFGHSIHFSCSKCLRPPPLFFLCIVLRQYPADLI